MRLFTICCAVLILCAPSIVFAEAGGYGFEKDMAATTNLSISTSIVFAVSSIGGALTGWSLIHSMRTPTHEEKLRQLDEQLEHNQQQLLLDSVLGAGRALEELVCVYRPGLSMTATHRRTIRRSRTQFVRIVRLPRGVGRAQQLNLFLGSVLLSHNR